MFSCIQILIYCFDSKLGLMVDMAKVKMTLTLNHGHRGVRKENVCCSFLTKFFDLDGIWCAVKTYWSDEADMQWPEQPRTECDGKGS